MTTSLLLRLRHLVSAALFIVATSTVAQAQMGGAPSASPSAPAASAPVKKTADRTDPLQFLLDKKKSLELSKAIEDSLKNYRSEMRHMEDVVYKDLDKAATKKEQGQAPSTATLVALTSEASARIRDIQAAYRDRGRELLNTRQRQQIDSLEAIWKRDTGRSDTVAVPSRKPPF